VDAATDTAVGNTIATKLHATTLTIAHRLRSVIDSDKILVLDRGRVVEFAHPADLLADPASALSSLVDETGPATAEVLRGVARDAAAAARGGDGNGDDAVTPVKSPPSLAAAAATLTPCRGRKGSGGAHGAAVGASPARIVLDAYATLRAAIMTADSEPTAEALRHLGVPPRAWQGRLRTLVDRLAVLAAEHCGASGEVSGVGLVGGGVGTGVGDGYVPPPVGSLPSVLTRMAAVDSDGDGVWAEGCCGAGWVGCGGSEPQTPRAHSRRRHTEAAGLFEAASSAGYTDTGAHTPGSLRAGTSSDDLARTLHESRRGPVGMLPVLSLKK